MFYNFSSCVSHNKTLALCSFPQCHVFIQEDGERSIVMAPAATSLINTQAVMEHFGTSQLVID